MLCHSLIKVSGGRSLSALIAKRNLVSAMSRDALVWVDCEMSGLNPERDVLLEVAMHITDGHLKSLTSSPLTFVINQPDEVLNSMNDWCQKQHKQSGLIDAVRASKLTNADCERKLLQVVNEHVHREYRAPLAGNSVGQDAGFLRKYMPSLMDRLHYRVIDVSSVKELAKRWYPHVAPPEKRRVHRATDDILESIEELKFYKENVFIKP